MVDAALTSPRKAEPLRLAYVVDTLVTGGAERLVLTFAETVRHRDDVDLTVFVLSDAETPFGESLAAIGTKIVRLPGRNLVDVGRFVKLVRALKAHRIEYVHAHLASSTILSAFAAFGLRIPFVTTIHNVRPSVKRIRSARRVLQWVAFRLPRVRVIAVGKAVADAVRGEKDRHGVVIVPNAISESVIAPDSARQMTRAALGLSDDQIALASVGAIIAQKSHDVLLEAFARVLKEDARAVLLVVGDAREEDRKQRLVAQATTLGILDKIRFLGMRRDIPEILAASDIFVSSSDWEGAPVSLLEAMANRLPAVMTDVGENDLVLRDTGSVLVPIQDPEALARGILDFMKNPALRETVATAVQNRALDEYGAEAWVDRLLDFYAETGRRRDWHNPRNAQ